MAVGWVMITDAVAEAPQESVVVTVYIPPERFLAVSVPPPPVHKYV
jgi:hypothetical protein